MKNTKKIDYNSNANQEIKQKFVNREVIYCASAMVYELTKKAECFPDYEDDLCFAFQGIPDYEEAASQAGWTENENRDICNASGNFSNLGEVSDADTWQELCEKQDIELDDYTPEIYEHWIVSDWLADKLENHGHKVLKDFFGMTIWCRPTTGQAILLDGVISEICAEMEISLFSFSVHPA